MLWCYWRILESFETMNKSENQNKSVLISLFSLYEIVLNKTNMNTFSDKKEPNNLEVCKKIDLFFFTFQDMLSGMLHSMESEEQGKQGLSCIARNYV